MDADPLLTPPNFRAGLPRPPAHPAASVPTPSDYIAAQRYKQQVAVQAHKNPTFANDLLAAAAYKHRVLLAAEPDLSVTRAKDTIMPLVRELVAAREGEELEAAIKAAEPNIVDRFSKDFDTKVKELHQQFTTTMVTNLDRHNAENKVMYEKAAAELKADLDAVKKDLGDLKQSLDAVKKDLGDLKQSVNKQTSELIALKVIVLRGENTKRFGGEDVAYNEIPLPSGELPSDKGHPKLLNARAISALTINDARKLLAAWGVPQEPPQHESTEFKRAYLRGFVAGHVGAVLL